MTYKCLECGYVFDDPKHWRESRGEHFGFPAFENMCGCPMCCGDFDELVDEEDVDDDWGDLD